MMRKVIVSGPVNGPLTEKYEALGHGSAKPTSGTKMNPAGGGGQLKGTKRPPGMLGKGK